MINDSTVRATLPALAVVAALALTGCGEPASVDSDSTPAAEPSVTAAATPEPTPETVSAIPTPVAAAPVAFSQERFATDLKTLAADEFEGRAPGSRGERLTVDYLVAELAAAGLEPGFGDSYLQPVPMVELVNEERSSIALNQAGESLQLGYPEQMIIGSRRLGAGPHGVEESELVFVGYGVVAPEYDWNDYAGLDVAGKTVVILVNDPGFARPDAGRFNGRAMTYYGRWTYKYEEAARQGAAAALIVHETEPASYPWEVVINSWSGPQFELAERGDAPVMALEGWITVDTARDLFARAGLDYAQQKARAAEPGFAAVALDGTVTASVRNRERRASSYNVAGLLPGSARPDEAVVYMAHWDHLGRNLALPGTAGIFNGAIDNASGTAAVLEIARMSAAAGPAERSQLFLAVTLEEYGLLGSRHYVNDPAFPPQQTAAVVNLDAFNFMVGPTEDMVVIGIGSSELEPLLETVLAEQGRRIEPEPTPEAGFYYRSDHFNFARAGIPALYAKSGTTHVELGREHVQAIERDYRDSRYHKPGDVVNPDWDYSGVAADAAALYRVGRSVADSGWWPNWNPGNEFRAIRDRQRP
ncbi:MAG: M28 family peptidase [Wenzhouxiangellaceae bacterium]|nr:M28 family peptidase [Wenzhouxiangellaceae bacterium]